MTEAKAASAGERGFVREPLWRCVGASVQGTSHMKVGKPCQDYHHLARPACDLLVAAVADGAGSASLAEVGSELAARTAAGALWDHASDRTLLGDEEGLRAALTASVMAARAAVLEEASGRGVEGRELASTLILVLAAPGLVALAQIGDGGVVLRNRRGRIVCLSQPETAEYVNETTFLVSPEPSSEMQVSVWRGEVAQVALLSDGLQFLCLKMPERVPHAGFFKPAFDFVQRMRDEDDGQRQLGRFLNSDRIKEHTDDDVTLVLAALS